RHLINRFVAVAEPAPQGLVHGNEFHVGAGCEDILYVGSRGRFGVPVDPRILGVALAAAIPLLDCGRLDGDVDIPLLHFPKGVDALQSGEIVCLPGSGERLVWAQLDDVDVLARLGPELRLAEEIGVVRRLRAGREPHRRRLAGPGRRSRERQEQQYCKYRLHSTSFAASLTFMCRACQPANILAVFGVERQSARLSPYDSVDNINAINSRQRPRRQLFMRWGWSFIGTFCLCWHGWISSDVRASTHERGI